MNSKKIGNIVYLGLFGILYCCSAFVSTMHAIEFFSLANVGYLAIMLALTYEIGQAAVLSSLLIDKRNQKKIVPWILMGILTICQILGNTFSVYKNICLNSMNELVWIKEPIFVWANDFPDKQATIIITWVMGALLPLISLLMCEMVTSYIHRDKNNNEAAHNPELEMTEDEAKDFNDKMDEIVETNEEDDKDPLEDIEPVKENNHEQEETKPEVDEETIKGSNNKEDDENGQGDDRSNEEVQSDVKGTNENDIEKIKQAPHFLNI